MPVRTAVVQTIATDVGNTYSANIQPYQQVDLAFKSNGYLISIRQVTDADGHIRNIDQGDYVTKGTVLANVQPDDYQQKLAQAEAQLAKPKLITTRQVVVRAHINALRPAQLPSLTTTTRARRTRAHRRPWTMRKLPLRRPNSHSAIGIAGAVRLMGAEAKCGCGHACQSGDAWLHSG